MKVAFEFSKPVLLLGGGRCDADLLAQYAGSGWPVVAADGGANRLRESGVKPAAIIGDLDSLEDHAYWQSVSTVHKVAEQDTTDFEKCLYSTEAPLYVAMGFSGKRLDHTLAALHIMLLYCDTKKIVLVTEEDVLVVVRTAFSLNLPVGTRLSVYPLEPVTFLQSSGLQYPLDNLTLAIGAHIGCSNCVVQSPVQIDAADSGGFAVIAPLTALDSVLQSLSG